ncbi:hypothetical protein SK128_016532, partial [Halocaridina rubra]
MRHQEMFLSAFSLSVHLKFIISERLAVILSLFHLVFCGVENNTIDGEEQMEARDKRFIYGGAGNGGLPSSPQEINHLLLQVGGHGFNLQSEGGSVLLHAKAAEDIATEAAGRAHEAVAQQEAAAWKAAQEASQKIAEKASAEAQKAQAAAAEKYQQAASLTQAAQSAQVSAFTEAATAAQVGKTLQAVDVLVEWALQQQHALTQVMRVKQTPMYIYN